MEKGANTRLPTESEGRTGRGWLVCKCVVPLVVVLVLNFWAAGELGRSHPNFAYHIIQLKWEMAQRDGYEAKVVFLGDSSGNQGVDTGVAAEVVGGPVLNLCTIGKMTAAGDLWILEEYLKRNPVPEVIVVTHVYDMWERGFEEALLVNCPDFVIRGKTVPAVELTGVEQFDFLSQKHLPVYSQVESVRELLLGRREGPGLEFTEEGFMRFNEPDPERVVADTAKHLIKVQEAFPGLSEINVEALGRLVEVANEYGVPWVICSGPVHDALASDAGFVAYHRSVNEAIRAATAGSPHVHVLDDLIGFPKEVMQNSDHVTEPAAGEYTRRLLELVEREVLLKP